MSLLRNLLLDGHKIEDTDRNGPIKEVRCFMDYEGSTNSQCAVLLLALTVHNFPYSFKIKSLCQLM